MRIAAIWALGVASVFMAVVAIMLDSATLFYMGTALIATLLAARLQAYLAVRGLRFERVAPEAVRVGELVTVQITVWSERRIRRPLIAISDNLPRRLRLSERTPSLPIAPAYDLPVRTQYQFRALRRGKYRWSGLTVYGTDALGLVTLTKMYTTAPTEITVFPDPIPVNVELPIAAGWGISEAESGRSRGAGIEPRGVREFTRGDSLRHVHWRSSARAGRLLVKEFEAGSHALAAFVLQRTAGTDVGGPVSSLDTMCGNAVYLSDQFLRQGIRVLFPGLDRAQVSVSPWERLGEIEEILGSVQAEGHEPLGTQLMSLRDELPPNSTVFVMAAVADETLLHATVDLHRAGVQIVALLYDARAFAEKGKGLLTKPSATEPEFVGRLQAMGAHAVLMPVAGASI